MSIVEATKDSFRDLVSSGLVLVDLWGPDCTRCLALMPDVERLADQNEELRVVKVEAPKARRLCMELKVMGLPAFLLFRDGEEVARLAGPNVTAEELSRWFAESAGGSSDDENSKEVE